MQAVGIIFGIASIVSIFLPWEHYVGQDSLYASRVSSFLGSVNQSFDYLFHLDFLPAVGALAILLGFSLAKKHMVWRILALIGALVGALIGIQNVLFYLQREPYFQPGIGLWIFAVVNVFALVLSILILANRDLLEKKRLIRTQSGRGRRP